jgi:4-hydroxy-tetrahydrodipicolinate reductase
MNIVLLGYGRMGQEVERVATERNHTIAATYDINNPLSEFSSRDVQDINCFIDFSTADAAVRHIRMLTPLHVPLVVGTTGWNKELPELTRLIASNGGSLFHTSNFSIGANLFLRLAETAAGLIDKFPEYDVAVHETHHVMKKDAPSGTALTLAEKIISKLRRKHSIAAGIPDRQLRPDELLVTSSRVGSVTGIHTVTINSSADTIDLTMTAHSRSGFAHGAVLAAEWMQGRKGVFTMEDFLFAS